MIRWIKRHLLPHDSWWFNMPYGPGWEGKIRQHVPAHVGQGFAFYWIFLFTGHPWAWSLIFAVWWEAIQRERWRRDGGVIVMPIKENIWDVILSAIGIAIAYGVLKWLS